MLRNVLYYVFVRFCIAIMYVHVCMYIDTMIYVRVGEYKWSWSAQIHLPPPMRDHTADLCTVVIIPVMESKTPKILCSCLSISIYFYLPGPR